MISPLVMISRQYVALQHSTGQPRARTPSSTGKHVARRLRRPLIPAKRVGGATWVYECMGDPASRCVEGDCGQLRVLLMERDPDLCDSLERMLARRGHYVVGASSSVEAECILESEGIDVVVAAVDPASPRNGVELLALVMERLPFVRCVGLTGAAAH